MAVSQESWKNWLIAALWTVTIILAGLGFGSIKDSLDKLHQAQTAHLREWGEWRIEEQKNWSAIWRVVDRICHYQGDRLQKEGIIPNYNFHEPYSPNKSLSK